MRTSPLFPAGPSPCGLISQRRFLRTPLPGTVPFPTCGSSPCRAPSLQEPPPADFSLCGLLPADLSLCGLLPVRTSPCGLLPVRTSPCGPTPRHWTVCRREYRGTQRLLSRRHSCRNGRPLYRVGDWACELVVLPSQVQMRNCVCVCVHLHGALWADPSQTLPGASPERPVIS